jgi:hypothetical protein
MLIFSLMTLMADAARVIEIRLRMMALGTSTPAEMFLMVSEKMNAMEEAKAIIARSGNPSLVIENYQKIVAANVARLSGQNVCRQAMAVESAPFPARSTPMISGP